MVVMVWYPFMLSLYHTVGKLGTNRPCNFVMFWHGLYRQIDCILDYTVIQWGCVILTLFVESVPIQPLCIIF